MEDMRRQEVRELARLTAPLTAAQQGFFQGEYGRHRRSPTTALLLCLLLGGFGAHYFYFGRHRAGLLRLLLSWTLVPAVLALFEARTIGARAMRYNASLASELLLAMRDTVHEQSREVAALETLSTPMALPTSARAALYAPEERDNVAESAEDALIAAAYAGREHVNGATSGHHALDVVAISDEAGPLDGANGASHREYQRGAVSRPRLPASEYDTWYDGTLHAAPEPAANGQVSGAPAPDAGAIGPDAPQWVPVPDWSAGEPRPSRADAADHWAMPDLDRHDTFDDPIYPQISAAELFDGVSLDGVSFDGAAFAPPPEPLGSDRAAANPGIAAAAAGAAAAWADGEQPHSAPERDAIGQSEREPVFMYQAAPVSRRPSVHLGPPAADMGSGAWAANVAAQSSVPRRIGEDVGLASLGSLLAAGLADLLRDRPAPPRTRPLTQPAYAQPSTPLAPINNGLRPISAPLLRPPVDLEDPWAVSDSIRAPLAESPYLEPAFEGPTSAPQSDEAPAPDRHWLTAGAIGAVAAGGAALAAETMWEHHDTGEAPHVEPAQAFEAPVPAEPAIVTPADVEQPRDAAATAPQWDAAPIWQPGAVEPAIVEPAAAEPVTAPAPLYASTPSQGLRRRITHRLFVRKMAVLEGKVVAESSVERQVELVDDDAIMAERVRQATNSAAREALQNLLQLAPPEALPAIRAQLLSLDLDAN
jgi:TM2 domain-containing membrane protein YozV